MDISMIVSFQILKNNNGNFEPISNKDAKSVSIGGFSFEFDDYTIPFDWDAFYGTEINKVFEFQTGKGLFWNDFEISECYDEAYEEIGIKKEEITAEFLASTTHIDEFFVDFDDSDNKEQSAGWFADNTDDSQYKINIIDMEFLDLATKNRYPVSKSVINTYNGGN